MCHLGRIVLGAFAVALRKPPKALKETFEKALKCVCLMVDFHLMAQYISHTPATLQYMEDYLENFHSYKDIFSEFWVYKKTKKAANNRTKTFLEETTQSKASAPAKQQSNRHSSQSYHYSSQVLDEAPLVSHFNFIKMHLLTHFRQHVEQYGNIPMFSTDISELAHKEQIKESYCASNKVDTALQIVNIYGRRQAFGMRLLNLKAVYHNLESSHKSNENDSDNFEKLRDLFKHDTKRGSGIQSVQESKAPYRTLKGRYGDR